MTLSRVTPGRYQVVMDGKTLEGDWNFISYTLIHDLHIDLEEICEAIENLVVKDHNSTNFGDINGSFQYSENILKYETKGLK